MPQRTFEMLEVPGNVVLANPDSLRKVARGQRPGQQRRVQTLPDGRAAFGGVRRRLLHTTAVYHLSDLDLGKRSNGGLD